MSVNQVGRKTKFSVCEDTATSVSYHVKERRLKVFLLVIQVRRELGVPFEVSELPNDLHELLFICLTNCSCITHEHWCEYNF